MAEHGEQISASADNSSLRSEELSASIEKLRAETEEIRYRIAKAKEKEQQRWWRRSSFWQVFLTAFAGLGLLGFYINYSVVPALKIENLELKLENLEKREALTADRNTLQNQLQELSKQLEQEKAEKKRIAAERENAGDIQAATEAQETARTIQARINQIDTIRRVEEQTGSAAAKAGAYVYVHVPDEATIAKAESLRGTVAGEQFAFKPFQVVGPAISPDKSQVRYFYRNDKAIAEALLERIHAAGFSDFRLNYLEGFEGRARRAVLEVWFRK